jgi:hypothetical protein
VPAPYSRPTNCPIQPQPHTERAARDQLECGHCDGYIISGMHITTCPDHQWLCGDCTAKVNA